MKCIEGKIGHPSVAGTLGSILAGEVTTHELNYHSGNACMDFRAGMVAFVAHLVYIDKSNLGRVEESLREHLKKCDCEYSPRGRLQLLVSQKR